VLTVPIWSKLPVQALREALDGKLGRVVECRAGVPDEAADGGDVEHQAALLARLRVLVAEDAHSVEAERREAPEVCFHHLDADQHTKRRTQPQAII
jgi:hypothetical protein